VSELQESIKAIRDTSNSIIEMARKLPDEAIRWKPSVEGWSILEVLCHLEEAVPYWATEIQRVVANPGVEWGRGHRDEARLAAVALATQRTVGDVVTRLQQGAHAAVKILETLRDADLEIESPSRNPRFGIKPMSFVLDHLLVVHLSNHLGQMHRNLSQFQALNAATESSPEF
jgi:uncharacterized damage-inducible protein DinB